MENKKQLLKEDGIENALMVAGFIPVVGEIADIALICVYLWRKEYLYAGLMLIALVPTVGDFIAKPLIRFLKGAGGAGKLALKNSDEMVKFAIANPQFKKQYVKLGEHLKNPLVNKTITQLEKVPGIGTKAASGLRTSIGEHLTAIGKLRPMALGKAISKEVAAGGKISRGIKNFFQGEKLAQYVAKKGMEPSNWLSKWYNVVYKGRQGRRAFVRNFIVSNKILAYLGLPSFEAFEEKMENDEEFRKRMANDPKFSDMVGQTTTPEEASEIEGTASKVAKGVGGVMGLGILKMLAKSIV